MSYYRDKVVLVTGAGSGIGAGLARSMAAEGAHLIIADLNPTAAATVVTELCSQGRSAIPCQLDVRIFVEFEQAVSLAVEKFGRLDILFNNAGVGLAGAVQDTELSDWKQCLDVNVWGVIHGVHAAYPVMLRQGFGQIVNIASAAGLAPRPGMVAYATAKAAVVGLSTSLRAEAADLGIKVNTICPLTVATAIFKNTVYKNLDSESLLAAAPIKPFPLEKCVARILYGVTQNQSIITVQFLAWLEWWLYRLWPPLASVFLNSRRKLFRQFRKGTVPYAANPVAETKL